MPEPTRPTVPPPDPFLMEVAELAGLDPEKILQDGFSVQIVAYGQAIVTARIPVDYRDIMALAHKHHRFGA